MPISIADPGAPGMWQCSYEPSDALFRIEDASVTIDCSAATIAATASFVLDNSNGQAAVEFTMQGTYGFYLANGAT